MGQVTITPIPQLNSVVIRQEPGTRFFVSTVDCLVIDRAGFLMLSEKLLEMGFIDDIDLTSMSVRKALKSENKKDGSNTG